MKKYQIPKGAGVMISSIDMEDADPIDTVRVELRRLKKELNYEVGISEDVINLLGDMQYYDREHLKVVYLSGQGQVLGIENISVGTLDMSPVHVRELFKGAILANAAAIIVVHNHPDVDVEPSDEDLKLIKKLTKAANIIGIPVIDFIIIGKGQYYSTEDGIVEIKSKHEHIT